MGSTLTQTRSAEFREALENRVLVADGAMGTMLYQKGVFINRCYDELNLSLPALMRDVHQEYINAGAEILETNTFGANRKRLAAYGFARKIPAHQSGRRPHRARSRPRTGLRRRHRGTVGHPAGASRLRPVSKKPAQFFGSRSKRWSKPVSIC